MSLHNPVNHLPNPDAPFGDYWIDTPRPLATINAVIKMARQHQSARRPVQLPLRERPRWGGKRRGAGRKPTGAVSHASRPLLASRFPVHVTLKVDSSLDTLREPPLLLVVEECLRKGKEQVEQPFRLVHYSIQEHHLHLVTEAADARALSRGIQGLAIRIARGINRVLAKRGRVFLCRYHSRILKTPREVRSCLAYVLNNTRRHAATRGERLAWNWIDDRSSGRHFDGWRESRPPPKPDQRATVVAPHTWLLTTGWRRHGLLRINEVPGAPGLRCLPTVEDLPGSLASMRRPLSVK
jgi:hypothetical protein